MRLVFDDVTKAVMTAVIAIAAANDDMIAVRSNYILYFFSFA